MSEATYRIHAIARMERMDRLKVLMSHENGITVKEAAKHLKVGEQRVREYMMHIKEQIVNEKKAVKRVGKRYYIIEGVQGETKSVVSIKGILDAIENDFRGRAEVTKKEFLDWFTMRFAGSCDIFSTSEIRNAALREKGIKIGGSL